MTARGVETTEAWAFMADGIWRPTCIKQGAAPAAPGRGPSVAAHQRNTISEAFFSAESGRKMPPALALTLVISPAMTRWLSLYRSMRTKENGALSALASRNISGSVSGLASGLFERG